MDESISKILGSMPDFLRTHDLVTLGLFDSVNDTYLARLRGHSPDYIKIGRKIFFPKSSIIAFLSSRLINGSVPKNK